MAVRAALRARRRQYEARSLLVERAARAAELEAEKRARERFVSVLAHDLRGPLSAAKMSIHMLLHRPASERKRLDLKLCIDRYLGRIEAMIQDLLDANRIQAGERLPLRIDECDLAAIVHDVVDELNLSEDSRIVIGGEEVLRGFWSADELRRAIWNLAANAIKYGEKGARVTIALRSDEDRVQVSIHNRGPAIPPDERARLFEPYRRAGGGAAGRQSGWGLGLTLVRGCAEAHGGTIRVSSDSTHGTTFTLTLPRDARDRQAPLRSVSPSIDDEETGRSPHDLH